MSDVSFVDQFLEHYGTKGMKWGVRRAAKKAAKADKKWQKNIYTVPGAIGVHNAAADYFNHRIGALNDKHPKADIWDNPDTPASKAYVRELEKLEHRSVVHGIEAVHGTSPSGKLRATYKIEGDQAKIVVEQVDAKHAAADFQTLTFEVNFTEDGKVASLRKVEDPIEHYGTKGMKWGVRKKSGPDRTRTTYKKAPSKLSQEELAKRISRMEIERKYNQLNSKEVSEGKRVVLDVLAGSGRNVGKTVLTGGALFAIKTAVDAKFGGSAAREITRRLK